MFQDFHQKCITLRQGLSRTQPSLTNVNLIVYRGWVSHGYCEFSFDFQTKRMQQLTLIWVGFLGVCFEVGGKIIPPV